MRPGRPTLSRFDLLMGDLRTKYGLGGSLPDPPLSPACSINGDDSRNAPRSSVSKETNPKDAVGIKKVPLMSVVPQAVIGELALALLEGARKYRRHNFRIAGVRASVYCDAAAGHISSFWEGEDEDPESRLSHIIKAIATLTVLRDAMIQDNWNDDRPPKSKLLARGPELNAKAAWIVENVRPDNPAEPYTELLDGIGRGRDSHNTNETSGQSGRHTDRGDETQ